MTDRAEQLGAEGPRDFDPILVAVELSKAGRHDYPVIAIQTAVELYIEQRIVGILEWRDLGPLGDAIITKLVRPPYNLRDDRTRALWESLTRDNMRNHGEWWPNYVRHVQLRNDVVHAGKRVSEEELADSFMAAFELMGHVNHVYIETGLRLGKLRELGTQVREDPDPY